MQIMLLAKDMGYDTVPMGGFNKEAFAQRFELADHIVPVILIAIGKGRTCLQFFPLNLSTSPNSFNTRENSHLTM